MCIRDSQYSSLFHISSHRLLCLLRLLCTLCGGILCIFCARCIRSALRGGIFGVVQKPLHLFQRILKHIFRRHSSTLDAGSKLQTI